MALSVVALGVKVPPAGVDQVPPVADPPTVPFNAPVVPPWHIAPGEAPALAVAAAVTVTLPLAVACPQVPVVVTV